MQKVAIQVANDAMKAENAEEKDVSLPRSSVEPLGTLRSLVPRCGFVPRPWRV